MHYRYMPLFPHELARDAKVGIQLPVSGEEKRRRAVMAAAMLAVPFVSFAFVAGLFFLLTTG